MCIRDRSRLVVGPGIACWLLQRDAVVLRALLRSRVALAPEIVYLVPLSIVTKQETPEVTNTHDFYCIGP